MRLGKLPPRQDSRTLRLARYLDRAALPSPPDCVDWGWQFQSWPMFRNDAIGDCTCATAGHMIRTWTSAAQGGAVDIADGDIVRAYSDITGYDPKTGENDNGAVVLDVLKHWRRYGIAGHHILAFAAVDPRDGWEVRQAIHLFGGIYIGAALPVLSQAQSIWHVEPTAPQDWRRPGSWGGHALPGIAYDPESLEVVTWGARKRITWAWVEDYVDEAFAVLSADWLDRIGMAPSGFALDELMLDLGRLAA